ncbi:hypothetical protein [Streptomyces marianii]|uniref:Uncharacterized protein n=1 Tax=Streptomyces marianii TaxID=1817406 RepID=A0A5R9E613_9ACTN|nr:hypothetical protein [Streptomyces marianii]TLQ43453.1 hypothetical protein FEF34_10120 [Streptomyces marianii]
MNTKRVNAAADVIHAAMQQGQTLPATIAEVLELACLLQSPETANEMERLRSLTNAQPAHLTEAQLDALSEAGNRALNDHYHTDLCHCGDWPASCASSGDYFMGTWDTGAFHISLGAVLGLWESMRADAAAAELARLREERDAFRAQRNAVFATNDELLARVERVGLERLQTQSEFFKVARDADRLRARVAELEAAAGDGHTRPVDEDPVPVRLTPLATEVLAELAEYGVRSAGPLAEAVAEMGALPVPVGDPIPYELTDKATAPLSGVTNCLACGEGLDDENITDFCSARCESIGRLRGLLSRQRRAWEDPHESPLARGPHPVPHDLPETEARP